MVPEHSLSIWLEADQVGELTLEPAAESLTLHYTPKWQTSGFALSPCLPLTGSIKPADLQRFLRNLFPEGNSFEQLLDTYRISRQNTFGLIRMLGSDTASGLTFLPGEQSGSEPPRFRPISDAELIERLDKREQQGLIVWDAKPRLSVAGIQDKINVLLDADGKPGFGEGSLCSTHILKFEHRQHTHLVLNEYVMMRLCEQAGLPVAEVELRRYGPHPALLVTRFDRQRISQDQVRRLYVIDGCQALNLPPEYKYERNFGSGRDVLHIREGASLPKLFALCQASAQPALDTKRLLDQVLFNLCINNHDAHGKNFSFFLNRQGLRLTPAYDLVNIAMYPAFDQEMAMALGDEFDSYTVNAYQLADFADSCRLPRKLVTNRLRVIGKALLKALDTADFRDVIRSEAETRFVAALLENVRERCQHLLAEAGGIAGMKL
ncbi:MAG: HipA domain-containing protein [Gammaproteobacteria bacterium]|nr:HipA domain-containing protein [Gammaproteobacteria bacterium]MBU2003833.1 HipA domain-containing protein [Gammaproteobacteria bacterium]